MMPPEADSPLEAKYISLNLKYIRIPICNTVVLSEKYNRPILNNPFTN